MSFMWDFYTSRGEGPDWTGMQPHTRPDRREMVDERIFGAGSIRAESKMKAPMKRVGKAWVVITRHT